MLYIICSTAFSYGTLRMLNTYGLYFFFGVSIVNIILRKRIKLNAAMVSIILYMMLMLIGLLYTPTAAKRAEDVMYKYITMAILVFCVVQYIDSLQDIKNILFGYMLAGLALAIYVYAQYGSEFWILMQKAAEYDSGHIDRLGSGLTNANTIGIYTMFSAMIAAYYIIFDRNSKLKTLFCLLVGVFCFLVSMAAASKKSVLIMVLACVCFWLYNAMGNRKVGEQIRNLLILFGCVILFFWLINTMPIFSGIATRMGSLFESLGGGSGTTSEVNRSAFMDTGIRVWLENFLFGAGTASSSYHLGVYAHNNFVELLMNSGIIGLMLFYGAYPFTLVKYLRNAAAYKQHDKLPILLFSIFVCITVCGIALVYYYERYEMMLMSVIISSVNIFDQKQKLLSEESTV